MRKLDNELKNKSINTKMLLEYGFVKGHENYIYRTKIYDEKFEIIVKIKENEITSKLIDLAMQDEYVLVDIQDSMGEFVGKIKEQYENILQDIIAKCTDVSTSKSEQSKEIIKYVESKYGNKLEYLWQKSPENAILRNKNNKWYAALLVVSKRKLKINSDEKIDIIDLRYQKGKVKEIIDNENIFEGYHMNKNSWITIPLDNGIETEKIIELIDNSYNLSLEK